jgi:hypothetical protein
MSAHNADVDTDAEVLALIAQVGDISTSATECNDLYGDAGAVPNWNAAACFISDTNRGVDTFDCQSAPGAVGKHRLCWCSTITTTAPGPMVGPAEFEVLSGPCTTNGECIMSPNYPHYYAIHQSCEIQPLTNKPIAVDTFQTEHNFDMLTINNVAYHGYILSSSQDDITGMVPTTNFLWSSDYSANNIGWKICILITSTSTMTETTTTTRTTTTTPTYVCHTNPTHEAGHEAHHVAFCLGTYGVDYQSLMASAVRTSRFERIIKQEVAEVANVTTGEIQVDLHAGSVISEITIMPNYTRYPDRARCSIWGRVDAAMSDGSLEASIEARQASDALISTSATGSVHVPTTGNHTRRPDPNGCDDPGDGFPLWAALLLALLGLFLLACLAALLWWLLLRLCFKVPEVELPPIPEFVEPVVEVEVEEEPDDEIPVYDPPQIEYPGKGMRNSTVRDFTEYTPSEAPTADPDSFSIAFGQSQSDWAMGGHNHMQSGHNHMQSGHNHWAMGGHNHSGWQ